MSDDLKQAALDYHLKRRPGKLEIKATKPMNNQRDLALAYSPGVAYACTEIERDSTKAADYTARGNLVAVITNGTAVLGLGAIGSLASKPVMEGKAVLFKEFADIDVFDIEVDELDPEKFIDTVARLEPTFGGINLEDIKAPECFVIEQGLKERMNIPVFHDDQHGTAIVVCAAILNGLRIVDKDISDVRLVTAGAGAAALACIGLLVDLGLKPENIILTDIAGVVYAGREEEMDSYKEKYAVDTQLRTLEGALAGADIFLGLSAAGVLKPEFLLKMGDKPLIMALANPTPEIMPELAREARPDAIIATGRTDYPNQVNNVLCFPFLFRGALDVGATDINAEMKMAAVHAIAELAMAETSDVVRSAYGGQTLSFGPDYLIPKPFDPRLMGSVAPAVAQAAMESGVATRPLESLQAYEDRLTNKVFRTGMTMRPVFDRARESCPTVAYAEGESDLVLEAIQQVIDEGIARPLLVGNPEKIAKKIKHLGLKFKQERDYYVVDPADNPYFESFSLSFAHHMARKGYSKSEARHVMRTNPTVLAATLLRLQHADAMICGTTGRYATHLKYIGEIIGTEKAGGEFVALNGLVLRDQMFFIADTGVHFDPTAEEIAEIVRLCSDEVRRFGLDPKVALLSHSNFGTHNSPSSIKMREALALVREHQPQLEIEGEMHAHMALLEWIRNQRISNSRLKGAANLLIMPNQDAANIAFNLLKAVAEGIPIGPILLGAGKSAHVVTQSITVRGLLNMTAIAAVKSL